MLFHMRNSMVTSTFEKLKYLTLFLGKSGFYHSIDQFHIIDVITLTPIPDMDIFKRLAQHTRAQSSKRQWCVAIICVQIP